MLTVDSSSICKMLSRGLSPALWAGVSSMTLMMVRLPL